MQRSAQTCDFSCIFRIGHPRRTGSGAFGPFGFESISSSQTQQTPFRAFGVCLPAMKTIQRNYSLHYCAIVGVSRNSMHQYHMLSARYPMTFQNGWILFAVKGVRSTTYTCSACMPYINANIHSIFLSPTLKYFRITHPPLWLQGKRD